MNVKTILVALDGSNDRSLHIIKAIGKLNLSDASKVILCHVFDPIQKEVESADLPHKYGDPVPYQEVQERLRDYQAQLPCPSQIEIAVGEPVAEIIRLAHIHHCELIAIGSRGLTGVKRIIAGSIGSQVVDEAPCSVLVVKN
jgi:nucleotide-binding universal stress UspA family protein